jgi:hypothetical protein
MAKNRIPACIGEYHDLDIECLGNPIGDDEAERQPCPLLPQCQAFKEHLAATNKDVADYCKPYTNKDGYSYAIPNIGHKKFLSFCDALVRAAKRGRKKIPEASTSRPPQPVKKDGRVGPNKLAKKNSVKALRRRNFLRMEQLREGFKQFKVDLENALGDRKFTSAGSASIIGDLYVVDHIVSSKYAAIYCKIPGIHDQPVVLFHFKPALLDYNVKFPLTCEEMENNLSKASWKRIQPLSAIDDGVFRSVLTGGVDKAKLSWLAELIGELVNHGNIDLPRIG